MAFRRLWAVAATACLAALLAAPLLVGCGGEEDEGTTAAPETATTEGPGRQAEAKAIDTSKAPRKPGR
ncbi:MAG: hypothetical protein GF320_06630 [Armatimonadia bacterium]|jgi:hypothetical protein|nr:hypothetical protein [Armatimonadia bacterium]